VSSSNKSTVATSGFVPGALRAEDRLFAEYSYQPKDSKPLISDKPFTRSELGLPLQGFVCFNNNIKITPDIFDSWMRILMGVKGTALWLFEGNEIATIAGGDRHPVTSVTRRRPRSAIHPGSGRLRPK
jgi:hypothetical protein